MLTYQGVKLCHEDRYETPEDQQEQAGRKLHRDILGVPPAALDGGHDAGAECRTVAIGFPVGYAP